MKVPFVNKFPAIQSLFFGKGGKNLLPFLGVIIPNVIAACLEGLSFALILFALSTLSQDGEPPVSGKIGFLTNLVSEPNPHRAFIYFISWAIVAQLCRSIFTYLAQVTALFLGTKMQVDGQQMVYRQIFRLSFACVNRYKTGELLEYSKIPSILMNGLMPPLNQLIVSFFTLLASIAMMFSISVPLTLISIFVFGLLVLCQKAIIRKVSQHSEFFVRDTMECSKQTVQSLHALRVIHAFQRQNYILETIHVALNHIASSLQKLSLWSQIISPLNEALGIIIVGAFLIAGESILGKSATSVLPTLLTFTIILHRSNARLRCFLENIGNIASSWGQMTKLEEILDDKDKEFLPESISGSMEFRKQIAFHNVSLKYPSTNQPSVRNLDIVIPRGTTTAFVGTSGAGKSSIMDLLLRLYKPTSGQIYVDDANIDDIDLGCWRDKLGVVSQDTFIFNSTIEENISFGLMNASTQTVQNAAEMAGAHKFISILPEGYKTVVGERGYRLSGGERQRIALARALIRDPEILILDEATSNLDSESERLIQNALDKLSHEKTIIIVAHRLSTIRHADQIIVIERGSLIERGTHEELLSQDGRYAKFWDVQVHGVQRRKRAAFSLDL